MLLERHSVIQVCVFPLLSTSFKDKHVAGHNTWIPMKEATAVIGGTIEMASRMSHQFLDQGKPIWPCKILPKGVLKVLHVR